MHSSKRTSSKITARSPLQQITEPFVAADYISKGQHHIQILKSIYSRIQLGFHHPENPAHNAALQQRINLLNETKPGYPGFLNGYLMGQKNINTDDILFLNFLLDNGANIDLLQITGSIFIDACFEQQNLIFLQWLLERCKITIEINSKGTHPLQGIKSSQYNTEFTTWVINNLPTYSIQQDTALMLAARYDSIDLFRWLITVKNNKIDARDSQGRTPLMIALASGSSRVIAFLLNSNADLTCKDNKGITVFHYAVQSSDKLILGNLIQRLNHQGHALAKTTTFNGLHLLHWMIKANLTQLISPQLLAEFDPLTLCPDGLNLAIFACAWKQHTFAETLMKAYPELDIHSVSPENMSVLHYCVINDAVESIKWLVNKHNIPLEVQTKEGKTPLLLAAQLNRLSCLQFFLFELKNKSINVNASNQYGEHIGHYLAYHNQHEIIATLLKHNRINFAHCDSDGLTMLDMALEKTHNETAKVCLDYHQNHHQKLCKKNNQPPLSLKKLRQLPALLSFFLNDKLNGLGVLGDWVEDGQPPLHMACLYANRELVSQLILDFKLDVNQANEHGETALSSMIKQNKTDDVLWFCERFNPKSTNLDKQKSSLLQLACEQQQLSLVEWCIKKRIGLSLLKKRADGYNALDLALIKQNIPVVSCLWAILTETERNAYVTTLTREGENQHIDFLTEHHFYILPSLESPAAIIPTPSFPTGENTVTKPLVNSEASFECTREMFLDGVVTRQFSLLKTLKHHREFDELFISCAEIALCEAIRQGNYLLLYHVLRIPVIRDRAHLNNNAALILACESGHEDLVRCLLRIPAIHQTLDVDNYAAFRMVVTKGHAAIKTIFLSYLQIQDFVKENPLYQDRALDVIAESSDLIKIPHKLNALAPAWISYPRCYMENDYLKGLLEKIFLIFNQSKCAGYLYGSSLYKASPSDFDILIPNIITDADNADVLELIGLFIADGGRVTVRNSPPDVYGYRKHNRHIIPMDWMGFKLEFNVSKKGYHEHARILDFTLNKHWDLKKQMFLEVAGIHSPSDLNNKKINTILDPLESFTEDPSRIFRAIRLIASEGFSLSDACDAAIRDMFSNPGNPFADNMKAGKLNQQLTLLFASNAVQENMDALHHLGILRPLFDCLLQRHDQSGRYYREQIKPYYDQYFESSQIESSLEHKPYKQNHSALFFNNQHSKPVSGINVKKNKKCNTLEVSTNTTDSTVNSY